MQRYRPGQVVLVAFPFTSGQGMKKRPALVLLDTEDADVVVARITSRPAEGPLDVELAQWRNAGLLLPCVVRVHKVATLEKNLIEKPLGTLESEDWTKVKVQMRNLWAGLGQ